jgi:hypothetical protein
MQKQEFPICPDSGNSTECNVYRHLTFPDSVYDKISAFYDHRRGQESRS